MKFTRTFHLKSFIPGCIILILCLVLFHTGCKKNEDTISGNWQGTLTIDLSHQHEEYQEWDEIIENPDGTRGVIEHLEHITWALTDRVVLNFSFSIDSPVYEAQLTGSGDAAQTVAYTSPGQCGLNSVNAPGFKVSVYGTIGSDTFTLRFVPDTVPVITVSQQCANVRLRLPVYGTVLLDVFSRLQVNLPAQGDVTLGGSGTQSAGSGFSVMAYIYNVTLTRR